MDFKGNVVYLVRGNALKRLNVANVRFDGECLTCFRIRCNVLVWVEKDKGCRYIKAHDNKLEEFAKEFL